MRALVGGEKYVIRFGVDSFDATVGEYEVKFIKSKEQLVIKRDDTIVEIDGFFVKSNTPLKIENRGFEFVIEANDFTLTYEFLKFIRFRTNDCSLVVELSGE